MNNYTAQSIKPLPNQLGLGDVGIKVKSVPAAAPTEREKKVFSVSLSKIDNAVQRKFDRTDTLKDGSVRLVKYIEYPIKDRVNIDEYNGYYGGRSGSTTTKRFMLSISDPKPRDMAVCISIVRTSANNYTAVYSDKNGTDITRCTGYDELNDYLKYQCKKIASL